MRIPSHLSMADKSAVCAIHDSVGKFCKHVRTSPFSERRTEHYEKNLHMQRKRAAILAPPSCLMPLLFACRRCICSFTSSKGGVLSRSSTRQLVRTDFPNRVIYRAHRRFIGLGSAATGHWPIKGFKHIPRIPVGADLSCTSPIYRPGERSDGPLADKSAVRQ